MIDLRPDLLKIVHDILQRYVPDRRVVVFGSRVKSKAKMYSDLDLCVMGDQPVQLETINDMREEFSESDLPIRVDIVDWATTDSAFREVIEEQCEEIKKGGE